MTPTPEREGGPGTGPILAAGGVLWRPSPTNANPHAVEVGIVHRPKYDDWSLPKGKLDPGEHLVETAVREIEEETGYRAVLGRPLGVSRYSVTAGGGERPKEVSYWAARAEGGRFLPHAEIDEFAWLSPDEAARRLTRAEDQPLLAAFLAGPVVTTPVIVLRHAHAIGRKQWKGDDDERPLSPAGQAQARALVGMLGAYGISSVVTSPSARAVQTVAPYAEKAGLELELRPALTEQDRDPGAAGAVVGELLQRGTPVVLCSHRKTLPSLLSALAQAADVPTPKRGVKKGEMLVAHCVDSRIRALERHVP